MCVSCLNPTELWDEQEHWLHPRSPYPTPVSKITNALVTERAQNLTVQNLVKDFLEELKLL